MESRRFMRNEINIPIRIDDRFDSYATFYDHEWARQIDALVAGTKLAEPVLTLGLNWKSAANTHRMPWLMIESLKSQLYGFMRQHKPVASRVVTAMEKRFVEEMGDTLTRKARKRATEVIRRLAKQASQAKKQATKQAEQDFDAETYWNGLLMVSEFALSLWGSQRICYVALYHAFENFVRQCVAVVADEGDDWRPGGELLDEAKRLFGKPFVEQQVADRPVAVARLVRNALVHHGGRETKELRKLQHGIRVDDELLQIMATDTVALFNVLKDRAYNLAERAVNRTANEDVRGQE